MRHHFQALFFRRSVVTQVMGHLVKNGSVEEILCEVQFLFAAGNGPLDLVLTGPTAEFGVTREKHDPAAVLEFDRQGKTEVIGHAVHPQGQGGIKGIAS